MPALPDDPFPVFSRADRTCERVGDRAWGCPACPHPRTLSRLGADRTHERQGDLWHWDALGGPHPRPLSRVRERGDQNHAPGRSNAAEVVLAHIFCPPLNPPRWGPRQSTRADPLLTHPRPPALGAGVLRAAWGGARSQGACPFLRTAVRRQGDDARACHNVYETRFDMSRAGRVWRPHECSEHCRCIGTEGCTCSLNCALQRRQTPRYPNILSILKSARGRGGIETPDIPPGEYRSGKRQKTLDV